MNREPPLQFRRVRGDYQLTLGWRVTLPDEYAKRFEQGESGTNLVLWRPGITCWITIYNQKEGEPPATTYEWRKSTAAKDAIQVFEYNEDKPLRFGYLLHEIRPHAPERWALHAFTFGEAGHVMMAIYFDRQQDIGIARKIWFSIVETREG